MKILIYILIGLNLFYCATNQEIKDIRTQLNERIQNPYDTTTPVKILFSTNRKTISTDVSCSNNYYSNQVDTSEKLGSCEVVVPAQHDIGSLDQDPAGSTEKFFKLENHESIGNIDDLVSRVSKNTFPEIIVFVHGFNVKFEEALLRAAQIKYDLKFSGEVVLFSWPAGADDGVLSSLLIKNTYQNNLANAKASIFTFKSFLSKLASSNKKIHLIVHSMGHQVVLPAVANLNREKNDKILKEMILNAPDFDYIEFKGIAENLKKSAERITVYCSPGDNALVASSKVNANKRLGSCEKYPGLDMINVNPVDSPVMGIGGLGHGYYSSRPILTDVYQVILGLEAKNRLFLRKSSPINGEDYVMRR
ncbi:MAG TPA: alpha/beta hydrolase [Leptospiraceae bacterium]|nr:alpha/beta hydrolase [Leptospiraceae bacterium]HMW06668.1 alpha/beta hydrolase [Leptospiraceae bacterium]HMX34112.1 alpha/beta hydrolase [Leptospiraceae bacterium]HMY33719.1 alpha/beta hydrolase [Leptospiraceae bacterium]HMZ67624.1 alpha/beta hydrolase [Leptospiraceae bacterium]